mmetsp:Transcript_22066/g.35878  ORF Transcript_22066/g.35878 Transcript_22066/m.35878 type:complete len:316 (+) Transcript_22066:105-1052(+)|eukprot:CAMPEP_0196141872 /NCGR_PEP_ID=MMETSP0910-20130528/10683_1 /TAXON_ID=49265 /ORGANISM="Thalassiosira rotula, Strain GSO102" /LENGTH=315 /DNA_ID=CAMNT_0041403101 /DNA_START=118 /DNA_END=1065 /DNA_ORIENTATION=-
MSYQDKIASQIPAEVRMLSGCHDTQTSADANITSFELPDPAGRRGGACTAALLQVLYDDRNGDPQDFQGQSWVDVLRAMRNNLAAEGFSQVPQLSSSRMIEVNDPMTIINEGGGGTKWAVLIGINYVGQNGELSGCHNDVHNITKFLTNSQGFKQENMMTLLDDGHHKEPTYRNIMDAFSWITRAAQPGDTVWIHYSGHGGRVEDQDGDEDDGYDETLIPVDFQSAGQIRDDDLLKYLVKPMREGVLMTCLMDCCHSGTVLDLPYNFIADGEHLGMEQNEKFDLGGLMEVAAGVAAAAAAAGVADDIIDECCTIL